ncbi:DNA internalization-related competence protein ComEC/Rec2 [Vibrio kyushuensis]|uniref:DNA internalization-related competence protein ComEC/Rec2 n=1 Tax=Vibrio kyushuensis TaxID=2910249 RepID=UPI003D13FAF8
MIFRTAADITINARIDSFFKQISHGYEGTVLLRSINGQSLPYLLQPKVRLVSDRPFRLGDIINATVSVKPIYGRLNEVGFDIESYYISQRWVARASVNRAKSYVVKSSTSYRQVLYQRILGYLEQSTVKGPIIALVFGERSFITKQQWKNYRNSGLIHLIAISGLHIGAMFFVGFWLGKLISRCSMWLLWAPWFWGVTFALGYAWLAGFSLPTQRALAMCVLGSIFILSSTQQPLPKKQLATLALVLLISPFSSFSSSFWLSFYAVSMVFYILGQTETNKGKLLVALKVQVLIVFWMVPITALIFSGTSISSLIYNAIFVPWFSFVIIPTILISLLMTAINVEFASQCWGVVEYLMQPIQWSTNYASNSWVTLSQNQITFIASTSVLLFIGYYLNKRARIMLMVLFTTFWCHKWVMPTDSSKWRVDVLDVGHGLAILIEKNGKAIVYDTGNKWNTGSIAESTIIPILAKRSINTVDGLILSHLDSDHAAGRTTLEERFAPRIKLTPQRLPNYMPCTVGETLDWEGLKFEVLWPPKPVNRAYNPHSCVIRVVDNQSNFSLLLTGDIEALVEWMLVRNPTQLVSDVLIAPHHGSATSSTPRFIETVNPEVVIASLAKGGRWQLPDPRVVDRYTREGADWLDTGQHGQITIHVSQDMWQVSSIRQREGARWYRQMLRNGVE